MKDFVTLTDIHSKKYYEVVANNGKSFVMP